MLVGINTIRTWIVMTSLRLGVMLVFAILLLSTTSLGKQGRKDKAPRHQ